MGGLLSSILNLSPGVSMPLPGVLQPSLGPSLGAYMPNRVEEVRLRIERFLSESAGRLESES